MMTQVKPVEVLDHEQLKLEKMLQESLEKNIDAIIKNSSVIKKGDIESNPSTEKFPTEDPNIKILPESLEKSLRLIERLCKELIKKDLAKDKQKNLEKSLKEEVDKAENHMNIENEMYSDKLKSLKYKLDMCEWQSLLDSITEIRESIAPFDFLELKKIFDKNTEIKKFMQNKDALIVIGKPLSGKSTAIHYLAQSKMNCEDANNVDELAPLSNQFYPNLIEMIKTKLIFGDDEVLDTTDGLFEIKPSTLELNHSKDFIFCEIPGLLQSPSPQQELIHILTINSAVGSCKTLMPVYIINSKDVGSNLSGLKENVELLNFYIPIFENQGCCTFLFAGYRKAEAGAFNSKAKTLIGKFKPENQGIQNIIKEIVNQSVLDSNEDKDCAQFILPPTNLKGHQKKLLKMVLKKDCVYDPSSFFRSNLSSKTLATLEKYLSKQVSLLEGFLNNQDFQNASCLLGLLKEASMFSGAIFKPIENTYVKCKEKVSNKMKIIKSEIDFHLNNENPCTNEFVKILNLSKDVQPLLSCDLDVGLTDSVDIDKILKVELNRISKDFTDNLVKFAFGAEGSIDALKNLIDRIKSMFQVFENSLTLEESIDHLLKIAHDYLRKNIEKVLEKGEFDKNEGNKLFIFWQKFNQIGELAKNQSSFSNKSVLDRLQKKISEIVGVLTRYLKFSDDESGRQNLSNSFDFIWCFESDEKIMPSVEKDLSSLIEELKNSIARNKEEILKSLEKNLLRAQDNVNIGNSKELIEKEFFCRGLLTRMSIQIEDNITILDSFCSKIKSHLMESFEHFKNNEILNYKTFYTNIKSLQEKLKPEEKELNSLILKQLSEVTEQDNKYRVKKMLNLIKNIMNDKWINSFDSKLGENLTSFVHDLLLNFITELSTNLESSFVLKESSLNNLSNSALHFCEISNNIKYLSKFVELVPGLQESITQFSLLVEKKFKDFCDFSKGYDSIDVFDIKEKLKLEELKQIHCIFEILEKNHDTLKEKSKKQTEELKQHFHTRVDETIKKVDEIMNNTENLFELLGTKDQTFDKIAELKKNLEILINMLEFMRTLQTSLNANNVCNEDDLEELKKNYDKFCYKIKDTSSELISCASNSIHDDNFYKSATILYIINAIKNILNKNNIEIFNIPVTDLKNIGSLLGAKLKINEKITNNELKYNYLSIASVVRDELSFENMPMLNSFKQIYKAYSKFIYERLDSYVENLEVLKRWLKFNSSSHENIFSKLSDSKQVLLNILFLLCECSAILDEKHGHVIRETVSSYLETFGEIKERIRSNYKKYKFSDAEKELVSLQEFKLIKWTSAELEKYKGSTDGNEQNFDDKHCHTDLVIVEAFYSILNQFEELMDFRSKQVEELKKEFEKEDFIWNLPVELEFGSILRQKEKSDLISQFETNLEKVLDTLTIEDPEYKNKYWRIQEFAKKFNIKNYFLEKLDEKHNKIIDELEETLSKLLEDGLTQCFVDKINQYQYLDELRPKIRDLVLNAINENKSKIERLAKGQNEQQYHNIQNFLFHFLQAREFSKEINDLKQQFSSKMIQIITDLIDDATDELNKNKNELNDSTYHLLNRSFLMLNKRKHTTPFIGDNYHKIIIALKDFLKNVKKPNDTTPSNMGNSLSPLLVIEKIHTSILDDVLSREDISDNGFDRFFEKINNLLGFDSYFEEIFPVLEQKLRERFRIVQAALKNNFYEKDYIKINDFLKILKIINHESLLSLYEGFKSSIYLNIKDYINRIKELDTKEFQDKFNFLKNNWKGFGSDLIR